MTERLAPALSLALFLALGACSGTEDPTPFEAEQPSLDVTAEAAPLTGDFTTTVWYPRDDCTTQASGDEATGFIVPELSTYCIRVAVELGGQPAAKGTVVFQRCDIRGPGTSSRSTADCDSGDAQWVNQARVGLDSNGEAQINGQSAVFAVGSAHGYRWSYIGQGSGVKNHTGPEFDVDAP